MAVLEHTVREMTLAEKAEEKLRANGEDDASYTPLDLTPLHKRWPGEPAPREWFVRDWIPAGTVTTLYGDGGTGKTLLAMQCGTCHGVGRPFLGLETAQGKALGFFCEDDDSELHRRQWDINAAYGLSMEDLDGRVLWYSRRGEDNLLCEFGGGDHIQLTPFYWTVRETVKLFKPSALFFDTAADTFGGNDIVTSHVRQFIQVALGSLAKEFGCAVILLAHPSLSGLNSGEGTHGSRSWNNAVRSRLYLEHEKTEDNALGEERVLTRKKANYAPKDEQIRLYWDAGTFWPVLDTGSAAREQQEAVKDAFMVLLQQALDRGERVSTSSRGNYAPRVFARKEVPGNSKRYSAKHYETAMDRLFGEGKIKVSPHRNGVSMYLDIA